MNAVHQTFAPFLSAICPAEMPVISKTPLPYPYARLQAQCDAQATIIRRMQPPRLPAGQVEYIHRFGELELICHLEYEAAEPGIAAAACLTAAYANGMDVYDVLSGGTVEEIEAAAAAELEE